MLFRKKTPRSCTTCLYATDLSDHQLLCSKHGVVTDSYACRKYQYDPCKRIPPVMKKGDPQIQKIRRPPLRFQWIRLCGGGIRRDPEPA